MQEMTVGKFKAEFSKVIEQVKSGEEITVLYGRRKEPVARLVPISKSKSKQPKKRPLGIMRGELNLFVDEMPKITEEEFLGLK
jgi:prevent-host-death family protein